MKSLMDRSSLNAALRSSLFVALAHRRVPTRKSSRCLMCPTLFKERAGKYFCSPACGRKAHYLSFSLRKLERGEPATASVA